MSDTKTAPIAGAVTSTDDPIFTHIIDCPDDKETSAAWLTEARIYGLPVTAICGHVWVPSRDPKKHPICTKCLDEAGIRMCGGGQ